eukprot:scaffold91429_cov37-Cyclotella_meneghiniana.AAC.1
MIRLPANIPHSTWLFKILQQFNSPSVLQLHPPSYTCTGDLPLVILYLNGSSDGLGHVSPLFVCLCSMYLRSNHHEDLMCWTQIAVDATETSI